MDEREELKKSLAELERQRVALGDAVVSPAITALREKLAALEEQPSAAESSRVPATVLCAELEGFTEIAAHLEEAEINAVRTRLISRWRNVIGEYDGLVETRDGLSVLAWWIQAGSADDQPEQAIRAALDMLSEITGGHWQTGRNLPRLRPLHIRMGLHTGTILGKEARNSGLQGEAPEIAHRLLESAPVDNLLISHDTYRYVRGVFDVHSLEPILIPGRAEPVQTYVIERAKPRAFRLISRGVEGIETRMVGRESELVQMQETFLQALHNQCGYHINLIGDAGLGKSRLLFEFTNWIELRPEEIIYFQGRATEQMHTQPYSLIRSIFASRFEIQDSDTAAVARLKLENGIVSFLGETGREKAHFIGHLIGFDFSNSTVLAGILNDTLQIRDRATHYLMQFFAAAASSKPVVLAVEDLHWADTRSLDLIAELAHHMRNQPALILTAARPDFLVDHPDWGANQPNFSRLDLQPLSKDNARRMVTDILRRLDAIPQVLMELVVNEAEGNPFYIEELLKMMIEEGVIVKGEHNWRVEPAKLAALRVPSTLNGVLQARLDAMLADERELLQVASVIGRVFWDAAIEDLWCGDESADSENRDCHRILLSLVAREVIYTRPHSTFANAQEFAFKHNLFHEVIYGTVTKEQRRLYHAETAHWLAEHAGDRVDEFSGWIADHFERAEEFSEAARWYLRAGLRAAAQYATADAVDYFGRSLEFTPEDQLEQRCAILLERSRIYDLLGNREEELRDILQLEEEAGKLGDPLYRAEAALRQASYAEITGSYMASAQHAQRAIQLGEEARITRCVAEGYLRWGIVLMRQNDQIAARTQLEQALELARTIDLKGLESESLRNLGVVNRMMGNLKGARECHEQALEMSRRTGDRRGEASALSNLGVVASETGDYSEAIQFFEQALRLCREIGDRMGEGRSLNNLGDVYLNTHNYAKSLGYMQQARLIFEQVGSRRGRIIALTNLTEIALRQGDYEDARTTAEQWLALCREGNDLAGEARALLALGRYSYHVGDPLRARSQYEKSLHNYTRVRDRKGEAAALRWMADLAIHVGNYEDAHKYATLALGKLTEMDARERTTLLYLLGQALKGMQHLDEALETLQKAQAAYQAQGQAGRVLECQIQGAGVRLAAGDTAGAVNAISDALPLLRNGAAASMDEPLEAYWMSYQVLRAANDGRAVRVLEVAYQILQEQAGRISDQKVRRTFLENVPIHQAIETEWTALKTG